MKSAKWFVCIQTLVYNFVPLTDTGPCFVKEEATGKTLPCQFPFKFKGTTEYGCTLTLDIDTNGEIIPVSTGIPWCSTKVSGSERQHVSGGGHWGDCSSSCAIADEKSKNLIQILHSTLMVNLIKLFWTRKKLLQHESLTPIKSGITSSQILQIQNWLD